MIKIINILITFFLLIFFPFIIFKIMYLNKVYFFCPVKYNKEIIIRNDEMGKGYFAAPRKGNRKHNAVDLRADINAPVMAARSGKVVEVGFLKLLGNYVEINHSNKLNTVYGHLNQVLVKEGQLVQQKRVIGLVGRTGNASHPKVLPHVHFMVSKDGVAVDPMGLLD